jgi:hypothetical protein
MKRTTFIELGIDEFADRPPIAHHFHDCFLRHVVTGGSITQVMRLDADEARESCNLCGDCNADRDEEIDEAY